MGHSNATAHTGQLERAQGCLLGQLAGDSLGSLVEFQTPESIRALYPDGVHDLQDGGTWGTLAGQPTDDSELALALARTLVRVGRFDLEAIRQAYVRWLNSGPFDCGLTTAAGLAGQPNHDSQSNGALMRISPLGIFGAAFPVHQVGDWAERDAAITHPNPVCCQCSALFAMAVADAVRRGPSPEVLYRNVIGWAEERSVLAPVREALRAAAQQPPDDYLTQQGWVLIALQNAMYQLLHAPSLEAALVETVMSGGDTDTNAAICGALLGAVYGLKAVPDRWVRTITQCRPDRSNPRCRHPRPPEYWPADALELAEQLLRAGTRASAQ